MIYGDICIHHYTAIQSKPLNITSLIVTIHLVTKIFIPGQC